MPARYEVPTGARLRVLSVSGRVEIIAGDIHAIEIEPDDRRIDVSDDGHVAETRTKSTNLKIRVPQGMNVSVGSVSGSVRLEGQFGSIKVSTVSGHIEVGNASGDVDVRSISGHLTTERVAGRCRCNTKSGRIEIGWVGREAQAHTMSGNIEIGIAGVEDVELKTISGNIHVRVDRGRHPRVRLKTLSGRAKVDGVQGSDFEINARTISGSIQVEEA